MGALVSPAAQDLTRVHALLVGVESYGLGNDAALDGPARAVCEVAAWLLAQGAAPGDVFVHVSPKQENRGAVRSYLEGLGLAHLEATEDLIRGTVIQKLKGQQGDVFLLYWCGHGFVESEFDRRLFCSDATQEDWRHIKLFDMLRSLQASQNPGFQHYIGFVDACAQPTAGAHPQSALPDHSFPSAAEQAHRDRAVRQYVLLSTSRNQFAMGAQGAKGLPLFTCYLLEELRKLPAGKTLDPKFVESTDRALQERFRALRERGEANQLPSRYWVRDWRDNIESLGFLETPIAEQDMKKLWGLAAGRCSKPDCGTDCVKFFGSDAAVLGKMAHVIAKRPKGQCGDPSGGSNAYDNLILLCPNHHTEIDKAPEGTLPVELLHEWKAAHERRVRESLEVKIYTNRADLFRDIEFLMTDNYQIWKNYGPESEEARRNPVSNAARFWQLRKISQIVPNNAKICAALNGNRDLLTPQEYAIAAQFKEHAAGFAANAIARVEGYPRFPQAFKSMVERNG